jgi:Arc/MetJ-type ribon-helix-helix transcriptional regulator
MQTEEPKDKQAIGFRCPEDLYRRASEKISGKYNTFSEYLRDLVRRDLEKAEKNEQQS